MNNHELVGREYHDVHKSVPVFRESCGGSAGDRLGKTRSCDDSACVLMRIVISAFCIGDDVRDLLLGVIMQAAVLEGGSAFGGRGLNTGQLAWQVHTGGSLSLRGWSIAGMGLSCGLKVVGGMSRS